MTIGRETLRGAEPVPGHGDAEPDRVRGHLSAARGAGRPLHDEGGRALPDAARGARDRRAGPAPAVRDRRRSCSPRTWSACRARSRRSTSTRPSSTTPSGWSPRPARPARSGSASSTATSPTAPARGRRSRWCWAAGRWRSCAAATTCCRTTSRELALDVLRHRARAVLRGAGRRRRPRHGHHRRAAGRPGARGRPAGPLTAMTTAPDRLLLRLEWRVLRRLDGRIQGGYRTPYRGSGMDFAGLREYVETDDARHIDWNATARLDEPQVRAVHRGPRADRVAGARPVGVDDGRRARPRQARRAGRAGAGAGPAVRPRRQPGRRGAARRRDGPHRAAGHRPRARAAHRPRTRPRERDRPGRAAPPTSRRCSTPPPRWPGAAR